MRCPYGMPVRYPVPETHNTPWRRTLLSCTPALPQAKSRIYGSWVMPSSHTVSVSMHLTHKNIGRYIHNTKTSMTNCMFVKYLNWLNSKMLMQWQKSYLLAITQPHASHPMQCGCTIFAQEYDIRAPFTWPSESLPSLKRLIQGKWWGWLWWPWGL